MSFVWKYFIKSGNYPLRTSHNIEIENHEEELPTTSIASIGPMLRFIKNQTLHSLEDAEVLQKIICQYELLSNQKLYMVVMFCSFLLKYFP